MTSAGPERISYRPAVLADADELGRLHVATWRSGYAGLLPEEFLAGLDVEGRKARWREILGGDDSPRTVVADVGDELVGFVTTGPDESAPGTGILYALYVSDDLWGAGLGYRLHEIGLEAMRSAGLCRAELWVLRTNARAISFYERQGWVVDGREQLDDHMPGAEIDEIGMTRQLI